MFYFPIDFGELNIDGLIDTGALSSAFPKAEFWQNSITGSTYNINWKPTTWVPNYGRQWTVRSTYCNSRTAIRSRWHYIQGKVYSHDKPHKPFDRSLVPTTQQYHTWYASRNLEFSLLFNAIEKWRSDIPKCYWTHTKPGRNHTATGKTNHDLGKFTDLHR